MKRGALLALLLVPACGGGGAPPVEPDARPFDGTQPAGTAAINMVVDDSANQLFTATAADGASDLRWKGAIKYDETTRMVTFDEMAWATGPWPLLYDDGPWASGGHEPDGAVAGDHKWGVTVFATPPDWGSNTYDYGVEDGEYQDKYGDGWLWPDGQPNGYFIVRTGELDPVNAVGLTLPAFGDVDMQVTLDTTMLSSTGGPWDASSGVSIKCGAWMWSPTAVTVGGDGKATLTFSTVTGPGHPFDHTGLFKTGDAPEFTIVIGTKEYKNNLHDALLAGVSVAVKAPGDVDFTPVTPAIHVKSSGGDGNAYVTIP
jgi:hypothetical protein